VEVREEFRHNYRERQQPTKHSAKGEVVDLALVVNLNVYRKIRFDFFLVHSELDLPSETEGVRGA